MFYKSQQIKAFFVDEALDWVVIFISYERFIHEKYWLVFTRHLTFASQSYRIKKSIELLTFGLSNLYLQSEKIHDSERKNEKKHVLDFQEYCNASKVQVKTSFTKRNVKLSPLFLSFDFEKHDTKRWADEIDLGLFANMQRGTNFCCHSNLDYPTVIQS